LLKKIELLLLLIRYVNHINRMSVQTRYQTRSYTKTFEESPSPVVKAKSPVKRSSPVVKAKSPVKKSSPVVKKSTVKKSTVKNKYNLRTLPKKVVNYVEDCSEEDCSEEDCSEEDCSDIASTSDYNSDDLSNESVSESEELVETMSKDSDHSDADKKEKPQSKICNLKQLTEMGLNPDSCYKYYDSKTGSESESESESEYPLVISALELDFLIVGPNSKRLKDKYAVAPEGYYWKACSVKNYYWFDWYELDRIPKN
jgi:hypothetical protein